MPNINNTIHHVSSSPFQGGAGRAGYRLHQGLIGLKQDSHWIQARLAAKEVSGLTNWLKPKRKRKIFGDPKRRRSKRFKKAFKGCNTCATNPEGWGNSDFFSSKTHPDIYHFHWMGQFLDWPTTLPELTKERPIVWTLHDTNPIQGAWHYAPAEEEVNEERSKWEQHAYRIKEAALSKVDPKRLIFVGPSKWMVEQCKGSALTKEFECLHIPYGLDTNVFSPIDTDTAKKELGINPNEKVIGFIADSLHDPRKGMLGLQSALAKLETTDAPLLLTVGSSSGMTQSSNQLNLGPTSEDSLLRLFYSACDVFICPSLQDNLPNTVLESMACQTPVIGFNVGGLPDMVRDGISGYLVPNKDISALSETIKHALANKVELISLGVGARKLAITEFNLEQQAEHYTQLYERLLT